ncbi:MAG: TIGR03936 family radical SAM-associated protein [Firmicutes bacterium]|nr:TIGR03936 family radical SAM-associated protein [Bacillota bacterium]
MLICKYTKTKAAAYIPHLDVLRHMDMILRRADIAVQKSQGFNPHTKIFFGPPLPIGVESLAEYFVVHTTDISQADFVDKFNAHSIEGLQISKTWSVETDPNIYPKIGYAEYVLHFVETSTDRLSQIVQDISQKKEWVVEYKRKTEQKTQDILPLVKSMEVSSENCLRCVLSVAPNLRAALLCEAIGKEYGLQKLFISKERQFDKSMCDIDDCIKNNRWK